MTEIELKITGEVASLHLEPGDRVIVTINDDRATPTSSFIADLRDQLAKEFPDNKVLILHKLSITREVAA